MTPSPQDLIPVLQRLGRPRVAVIGDFMLDRYVWGEAQRVSPEAPVPVVHAHHEEDRLGGAGNVVANLLELGAEVLCFGVVGADDSGRAMVKALEGLGADASGLVTCPDRPTTQKIRVMARNQQMLRVDREERRELVEESGQRLVDAVMAAEWDAVVLSDYAKGCLTRELVEAILAESRRRGRPSVVDPKHHDFRFYRGATLLTPNRLEAEAAAGEELPELESLRQRSETLRKGADIQYLLVTLGAEGMLLLGGDQEPIHLPTAARQVYDVTGAGDTVLATAALALADGLPAETAMRLANCAASLAVGKVGTAAVGRDELLQLLRADSVEGKVHASEDLDAIERALRGFRAEGRRVVFTNGCFDILHAGHVRYLRAARGLGDVLVVGLNSDESVRRLKGEDRPFNPVHDRAEVLASLECVEMVVSFPQDTPEELIRQLKPDVLVKGADWEGKGVAGAEFVERSGGEVRFIDLLPGRSTSGIADRIRRS